MENRFSSAIPQLPVTNVGETLRFYQDVLDFTPEWTRGADEFAAVRRGGAALHFFQTAQEIFPASVLLPVRDAGDVLDAWRARGATIAVEIDDKPWGTREFVALDNNGHRLRVASPRRDTPQRAPSAPLELVRIVRRLPTTAEYQRVATAVGWANFARFEAAAQSLSRSLFSVVAELDGRCIGTARVAGDGAVFFYIMDVGVLPEFQGRGVGTRLMNHVVDFIAAARPAKALIGLFAPSEATRFFERFGFSSSEETEICGMTAAHVGRA
jgi:ribosomal protein S18 acetylase RimI-like enzyme